MCNYCKNVFTGNLNEDLICSEVKLNNVNSGLYHRTFIDYCADDGEDGAFLISDFFPDDADGIVTNSYIKINYCPICGSKFKED